MTSLMRNFLRSSSSLPMEGPANERTTPGSPAKSLAHARQLSFNDLSCGASSDALCEYDDAMETCSLSQRSSMEQSAQSGVSLSSRNSVDPLDFRSAIRRMSGSFGAHPAGEPGSSSLGQSKPVDIPGGQTRVLLHQNSCPPTKRQPTRRKQEGKIDGLDYYDWSEMLRSTSL